MPRETLTPRHPPLHHPSGGPPPHLAMGRQAVIALRLALRDLRGGLAGLRLLAVCLFLGVLALAGVGSLSAAIVASLAERGQEILGGDVQLVVSQREATPEELAAFSREGRVSHITRMRAMAARLDGEESVLVELKGVDEAWPLFGTFRAQPGAAAARRAGGGRAGAGGAAGGEGRRSGPGRRRRARDRRADRRRSRTGSGRASLSARPPWSTAPASPPPASSSPEASTPAPTG